MAGFELNDAEWRIMWRIIAPLLPDKPRAAPRADDRKVLNGILHVLRSGSPWRDLPEC